MEGVKREKGVITGNISNTEAKDDVTAQGADNFADVAHEDTRLKLDWKFRHFPAECRSERQDDVVEAKIVAKND
jgi:hypothetical protein